jgi:hypothetical protein
VQVVTKGFVSVEYAAEVDDGEEIDQRDANGDSCGHVPARQRIKFYNVTVTACRVDPELYSLFTGAPIVLAEAGVSAGLRVTTCERKWTLRRAAPSCAVAGTRLHQRLGR